MTRTSLKKNLTRYIVILAAILACSKTGKGQGNCTDIFEPNDSKQQAAQIQPAQVYEGLIGHALDIDWFKFALTAPQPNVRVTLFNLPANYNLFLYDPGNVKIGFSKNNNTEADTIIANELTPGIYYIKIRGKAGKSDPSNCYSLNVETSGNPFRESSVDGEFIVADSRVKLYPNPVTDQLIVQCDEEISSAIFSIYNLMGHKIFDTKVVLDEESKATLDVRKLAAGQYFLQITHDRGAEVKKFVVSK